MLDCGRLKVISKGLERWVNSVEIMLMAYDWADDLVEDGGEAWRNRSSSFSIPRPLPIGR